MFTQSKCNIMQFVMQFIMYTHANQYNLFQPPRNCWLGSRPWPADTQTTDDALLTTLIMTDNVYDKINAGFPIVR